MISRLCNITRLQHNIVSDCISYDSFGPSSHGAEQLPSWLDAHMTYWPIPKVGEMKTTWHSLSTSISRGGVSVLEGGTFCVFIPHGYTCVNYGGSQRVTTSNVLFDPGRVWLEFRLCWFATLTPHIELWKSGRVFVIHCWVNYFFSQPFFFSPYQGEASFTVYPDL